MNAQALSQWITLLTGGLASGATGIAAVAGAVTAIRAAMAASGVAADTAQLEFIIADAPKRKAREDDILAG